jgi:hypothetical protein
MDIERRDSWRRTSNLTLGLVATSVAGALLLLGAACGSESGETTDPPEPSEPAPNPGAPEGPQDASVGADADECPDASDASRQDGPTVGDASDASPGSSASAVAMGEYFTCALRSDATTRCWGNNYQGHLGDGTNISRSSPTTVLGLSARCR